LRHFRQDHQRAELEVKGRAATVAAPTIQSAGVAPSGKRLRIMGENEPLRGVGPVLVKG
jgi:hypothetical protein